MDANPLSLFATVAAAPGFAATAGSAGDAKPVRRAVGALEKDG